MKLEELEARVLAELAEWAFIREALKGNLSPQESWQYYGKTIRLSREMMKTRTLINELKESK